MKDLHFFLTCIILISTTAIASVVDVEIVDRKDIVNYVLRSKDCEMYLFNRLVKVKGDGSSVGLPLTDLSTSRDFQKALNKVKKICK